MIAVETTTMITMKLRGSTGWIFVIAANIAFALRRIIPNSYVYIGRGKEIHQRFSLHGVWLNGIVIRTELWYVIAQRKYIGSIHGIVESARHEPTLISVFVDRRCACVQKRNWLILIGTLLDGNACRALSSRKEREVNKTETLLKGIV